MKTVPLHGKKAAGRVALVDDGDYEMVSQYRWYIYEPERKPGHRQVGPYAIANCYARGWHTNMSMHCLIMGVKGVDHVNHDGLDNQRSNLRPATNSQNGANQRAQEGRSSRYKGVSWDERRKKWRADIKQQGKPTGLGSYISELEAAYAYDAAARRIFGEFACTNFPEGPAQALLDQWQAEREAHEAAMTEIRRGCGAAMGRLWGERQPETRTCEECGQEYQSRSTRSFYCGMTCRNRANGRRRVQRELEGRLF